VSSSALIARLSRFVEEQRFIGKGPLCVALVVTERAKTLDFPIDSTTLISEGSEGQVVGLGKGAVQRILKRHGISKTLANEGGRTSRGSIRNMRVFVELLNALHADRILDLEDVENFWISHVEQFFAAKPFKLRIDPSQGLKMLVHHVVTQAIERQKASWQGQVGTPFIFNFRPTNFPCWRFSRRRHRYPCDDISTRRRYGALYRQS
jgi:hypothetical protein